MKALIFGALLATSAMFLHDNSGGCPNREALDFAWKSAQRLVIVGDYDGGMGVCGISEDDAFVVYILDARTESSTAFDLLAQ